MFQYTYEADKLTKEVLPETAGVYCWIDKATKGIVYVGSATGNKGLRNRIWHQHLNPNYLESRADKFTRYDLFQINHPIYINNKVAIDKSTFRKSVARRYLLKAGEESVKYILEHYLLSFEPYKDPEQALLDEKSFIARLVPAYQNHIASGVIDVHGM